MMSRDHLSMHIDASSLQLMLRLLSIDTSSQSSADDDDLCRTHQRLYDIVRHAGEHSSVTLDNMTVSHSLLSKQLLLTKYCLVMLLLSQRSEDERETVF